MEGDFQLDKFDVAESAVSAARLATTSAPAGIPIGGF